MTIPKRQPSNKIRFDFPQIFCLFSSLFQSETYPTCWVLLFVKSPWTAHSDQYCLLQDQNFKNLEISPDTRIEEVGPDTGTKEVGPDTAIEEVGLDTGAEEVVSDRGIEEVGPDTRTEEVSPYTGIEEVSPDTGIEEHTILLRQVVMIFSHLP
jgi:hypothetical protein